MKAKDLLKNGIIGILSLYLTECTKPKLDIKDLILKKPVLSDYIITDKRFEEEFNTTIESNCIIYREGIYHLKEPDVNIIAQELTCVPIREPKEGDRYVIAAGYMFVVDGIIGEELEKYVCVENRPYITAKELNNGKSVWLIDPESDGEDRIPLDGRFPRELIPKPLIKECLANVE